ncbi:MAG TPA: hypothetical protein VM943_08775 [Pyrinomonadaceae bacterium]|nr:hypothetical protein [Pyrinomonadaceae bacterium]
MAPTKGKDVNFLIEMVGGEVDAQKVRCLAQGAAMIVCGAASGEDFQVSALGLLARN